MSVRGLIKLLLSDAVRYIDEQTYAVLALVSWIIVCLNVQSKKVLIATGKQGYKCSQQRDTWVGEASRDLTSSPSIRSHCPNNDRSNAPCTTSSCGDFQQRPLTEMDMHVKDMFGTVSRESLPTATGYPRYDYAARHRTSSAWPSFCKSYRFQDFDVARLGLSSWK